MAEAFGVGTGVLSIISFGIQVCQGCLQYYDAYKNSNKTITKLFSSTTALKSTLELIQGVVKQEFSAEVVENVKINIKACEDTIKELRLELERIRIVRIPNTSSDVQAAADDNGCAQIVSSKSKTKVRDALLQQGRRLLYPFRESTLLKLQEDVDHVLSNLALAIQALDL